MAENRSLVRNFTYSEQAREVIRRRIFDGTYLPGQRLKEAEVSKELGISRAPTREAIQSLAREGLVEIVPHKGAMVATFEPGRVQELYEVREALETMAVRLVAERITPRQIEDLRKLLDLTSDAIKSNDSAPYPEELNFHDRIFEIAGNPRLQVIVTEIHAQLRLAMLRSGATPGRASDAYKEHAAVFNAIQERDPESAERAMRDHIRRGLRNIKDTLTPNASEAG